MVKILDSTLREGEQTPGISFPTHAKLALAKKLDRLGVDFIETGHPVVSSKIKQGVRRISAENLDTTIAAHARTVRHDIDLALDCGADFIGIFYCVSSGRLDGVFQNDFSSALDQIAEIVGYTKEQSPETLVRYTPEDTVRSDFDHVVEAASRAVEAGADIISIADTTGHMVPGLRSMYDYVSRFKDEMEQRNLSPDVAVHCHDDRGVALANALDAYRAGADIIDVSLLGLGERAGIVDLAQLMSVLSVDFSEGESWDLNTLPHLYSMVQFYTDAEIPPNFPITGENAFTHCAGVHTHAATKNPAHYQSLDPSEFGREMMVSLDHMSGESSVIYAMEQIGITDYDEELVKNILSTVKEIGERGRTVQPNELEDIVEMHRTMNPEP